jgi:hypothetical protein
MAFFRQVQITRILAQCQTMVPRFLQPAIEKYFVRGGGYYSLPELLLALLFHIKPVYDDRREMGRYVWIQETVIFPNYHQSLDLYSTRHNSI